MFVFGLFWTSSVVGFLSFALSGLHREIRAAWVYKPTIAVVVNYTAPETKTDEFGDKESVSGKIEYRYVIGDKSFDDDYFQGGQFSNEYSRKFSGPFKKGDRIEIWYDPDDPARSTLEPIAEPQMLGILIFILPFLGIGLRTLMVAVTGNGPRINFSRSGSSRKGMSVSLKGSGPYFGVFTGICALSSFGFIGLSMLLSWQTGWVIALAWIFVGIPASTFALGRMLARRRENKDITTFDENQPESPEYQAPAAADLSENLPSYRKKMLGAAFFTLFWCGLTGVFVGFVAHAMYKSYDARRRFTSVGGHVIASKVKTVSDSDGDDTYKPLIKYGYAVAGQEYTSTRYAFGAFSTSNHGGASEIVKAHPPGKEIIVWYDPRDPSQAVLCLETSSMHYFLLLFLQPFILVGLGGIFYTLTIPSRHGINQNFLSRPMRLPWSIPSWGTLRRGIRGIALYYKPKALMSFVMGYGLTCFLSMFVVAIYHGAIRGDLDHLPTSTIGSVFTIAAGVGAISLLVSLFKRRAQFEIDESMASLYVKSSKREFRVSFAEIDHWLLKMVARTASGVQDSDESSIKQAPLLMVKTTDGAKRPIHLFGTTADQGLVAEKVAQEFAGFTGKKFAGTEPGEETELPEKSIAGMLSFAKAQMRKAKKYADLT